jgi:NADH-quinone oxidoreductase subunit G/NADP-reducing hydrogenase subunit HndD
MSSGAADIFGLTGGVMEAALRTVYELVTGRELPFDKLHVTPIVGLERIKEAIIKIENPLEQYSYLDGVEVKIAVTSGLKGARILMEQIAEGKSPYHFIEVMGCPGGCITGGGQPRSSDPEVREKRLKNLYDEDESKTIRKSHENPYIVSFYKEFLGEPNGHLSHELLHTHYVKRGKYNEHTDETFVLDFPKPEKSGVKTVKPSEPLGISDTFKTRSREELESVTILSLEAENKKLKSELEDTLETVDILKRVIADYVQGK